MKKNSFLLLCTLSFLWINFTIASAVTPKEKPNLHGFKLIEKRFVTEVNADCYYYEHIVSGARLIKVAADDPNKTFCIGFHTVSENDCGTAHILEHSVLNGSENFPVKSPFDLIIKGSLKTFVNALTGKDITYYPVASMNEKDYFNLMHIYLDAVFYPLIYTDKRIFEQEGWHYELTSIEEPVVYRGVVYGEMKGAFSNPSRYLNMYTFRHLFPDNAYCFESGGYPDAIPTLTYEAFTAYHKKYYHPDNSYIILYGDADIEKELAFINDKYLSHFKKSGNKIAIKPQQPFKSIKVVEENYPVMEGSDTLDQTFLSLSFVYGEGNDQKTATGLSLLAHMLFNTEDAPVRLALQKAGIGSDVSAGNAPFQQNVFQIIVRNANLSDRGLFYEIVMKELQSAAEKGLNLEKLTSYLNRFEFNLKEDNDAQKGVSMLRPILSGFIHKQDPFQGLMYEDLLSELRQELASGWFTDLISQALINNNHALLLSVAPKPGMDQEKNELVKAGLDRYKASLSPEQVHQLMEETQSLIAYQKREDKPEAIAMIPTLSLNDVNPKALCYSLTPRKEGKTEVLHYETFTNGILYCNFFYDMTVIPENMIPYASLLTEMLTSLNTRKNSYADLDLALNNNTGGFNTYLTYFAEQNSDQKMKPFFVVSTKGLTTKASSMMELTAEVLMNTLFDDDERIQSLLERHLARVEHGLKSNGAGMTGIRVRSYFSRGGVFDDITSGYAYYQWLKNVTEDFSQKPGELADKLQYVAQLLFNQENLIVGITCGKNDYEAFITNLPALYHALGKGTPEKNAWSLAPKALNEGFCTSSKVQYVYGGWNFKKLGYEYDGKMQVLNRIISREWLYPQLRVIGGAYGGYSTLSHNGNFLMISYRDPNLKQTLQSYKGAAEFLKSFNPDETTMTRYILGTIASLDQPRSTSQKGSVAIYNYFTKLNYADYQKERDAVLSTTPDDIVKYAGMIEQLMNQNTYCIYGNDRNIEENKDLFAQTLRIE